MLSFQGKLSISVVLLMVMTLTACSLLPWLPWKDPILDWKGASPCTNNNHTGDLQDKNLLVVFVHGIFGGESTWQQFPALIAKDERFEPFYKVGEIYYSNMGFIQAAQKLQLKLEECARFQRIILVAHSQGGLAIQRMLTAVLSKEETPNINNNSIARKTAGVLFFGTPTEGALLAQVFGKIYSPASAMDPLSPDLIQLQSAWITHVWDPSIRINTPQKRSIPFLMLAGTDDQTVQSVSALGVVGRGAFVAGDHTSMKAVTTRTHTAYIEVAKLLQKELEFSLIKDLKNISPDRFLERQERWQFGMRNALTGDMQGFQPYTIHSFEPQNRLHKWFLQSSGSLQDPRPSMAYNSEQAPVTDNSVVYDSDMLVLASGKSQRITANPNIEYAPFSVLRWQAPADGFYEFQATVSRADASLNDNRILYAYVPRIGQQSVPVMRGSIRDLSSCLRLRQGEFIDLTGSATPERDPDNDIHWIAINDVTLKRISSCSSPTPEQISVTLTFDSLDDPAFTECGHGGWVGVRIHDDEDGSTYLQLNQDYCSRSSGLKRPNTPGKFFMIQEPLNKNNPYQDFQFQPRTPYVISITYDGMGSITATLHDPTSGNTATPITITSRTPLRGVRLEDICLRRYQAKGSATYENQQLHECPNSPGRRIFRSS